MDDDGSLMVETHHLERPSIKPQLNPKRFATTTGLVGVGIGKLEAAANHCGAVIEDESVEVQQALAIANNFETVGIVKHIVMFSHALRGVKIHHVGHARAAPLTNANP